MCLASPVAKLAKLAVGGRFGPPTFFRAPRELFAASVDICTFLLGYGPSSREVSVGRLTENDSGALFVLFSFFLAATARGYFGRTLLRACGNFRPFSYW